MCMWHNFAKKNIKFRNVLYHLSFELKVYLIKNCDKKKIFQKYQPLKEKYDKSLQMSLF